MKGAGVAFCSVINFPAFLSFPVLWADLKESIARTSLSIEQMYCDPLLQQVRNAVTFGKCSAGFVGSCLFNFSTLLHFTNPSDEAEGGSFMKTLLLLP